MLDTEKYDDSYTQTEKVLNCIVWDVLWAMVSYSILIVLFDQFNWNGLIGLAIAFMLVEINK